MTSNQDMMTSFYVHPVFIFTESMLFCRFHRWIVSRAWVFLATFLIFLVGDLRRIVLRILWHVRYVRFGSWSSVWYVRFGSWISDHWRNSYHHCFKDNLSFCQYSGINQFGRPANFLADVAQC